jgi:TonB family protein
MSWAYYQHVLQSSTLEWLPSQPFLLKVEFQLYDVDGKPVEKGTAEESWTNAGGKAIRIESPSLNEGTDVSDEAKTHTRESYLVHQALAAIARPFHSPVQQKDFAIYEFHQMVGGSDLACFALESQSTWNSAKPAYCTDIENRLVAMTGPFFTIERSDLRKYRDHEVPMDLKLSYEGKPAVTMHVLELDALPQESVSVDKLGPSKSGATIPGEVISGKRITCAQPKYPKEAKKKHLGGSVVITAVISKEGTVKYLDVVASPNVLFSQSALDAVKTWTYQPYILNGEPVDVDTTITVNYALSR